MIKVSFSPLTGKTSPAPQSGDSDVSAQVTWVPPLFSLLLSCSVLAPAHSLQFIFSSPRDCKLRIWTLVYRTKQNESCPLLLPCWCCALSNCVIREPTRSTLWLSSKQRPDWMLQRSLVVSTDFALKWKWHTLAARIPEYRVPVTLGMPG